MRSSLTPCCGQGRVDGRALLALERLLWLSVMSQTPGEEAGEVPAVDVHASHGEPPAEVCGPQRQSSVFLFLVFPKCLR